jgi:uncharacterized membrane protein
MSMNFNNNNNKSQVHNPHLMRGIAMLLIATALIIFLVIQIQEYYDDIEKANQLVKDSAKAVELSKQRVAEAQARLDYYNNN